MAPSTGGRPAKTFDYNGDYAHILTIYGDKEYGVSAIHYRISNLLGHPIEEKNIPLETINLDRIFLIMDDLFERYPKISSLGFGIPGVVSKGYISHCDLPHLKILLYSYFLKRNTRLKWSLKMM